MIVAGLTLLIARKRLVIVLISGKSMEPNYRDGDKTIAWRGSHKSLSVGQVVVIDDSPFSENPIHSRYIVKRVAALAGREVPTEMGNFYGDRVPAGHIAVLGDNRSGSIDSRHMGFIPCSKILATVVFPVRTFSESTDTATQGV